ncbi:hypothetical protein SAMN06265222_11879 [Neorhodopirellula lusitana]|uniref:Uncharacterized protein n=1 Tax=Neorhodopirellula lusitana TaxID=445327 RepID=A0ABY1QME7_9BACT|nr:hypothetical protein [Neorhodopirellula lusitana]SMP74921.1 hypothetical protein SAMN06265222_11879 [Neorhodopirellula lusitana]
MNSSNTSHRFPYMTDYVNDVFATEKHQWDFIFLRPLLLVFYFFLRTVSFPLKFVFHRVAYGFEAKLIDWSMSFGMKYLARYEAAELMVRHVQIEPLLYRHVLLDDSQPVPAESTLAERSRKLNGIDGDFGVEDLQTVVDHNMTIGHDELSYELIDRFDRDTFLANVDQIKRSRPEDHSQYSKVALQENRDHSWQILGATNIVLLIVTTITIFADLKTAMKALGSFDSDSILLWCLKHLYAHDPESQINLDFFMQEVNNRGHYNSSAFFSNPSQYLYYHIVFDEVAYDLLRNQPPTPEDI